MITWYLAVIVPLLASLWSLFVAKTGRLVPLPHRKPKAIRCANGTGETITNELAIPEEPEPVYELFGHPAPPVALLSASLPTAPTGYGWEIYTLANEAGNPALRLSMLDLKTSKVEDAIEADLVIARRWKYAKDDTYAAFYRRVETQVKKEPVGFEYKNGCRTNIYGKDPQEMLGKVMMANLITPMVDWARLITLRYIVDHPDETKCNYVLMESPGEKVDA